MDIKLSEVEDLLKRAFVSGYGETIDLSINGEFYTIVEGGFE